MQISDRITFKKAKLYLHKAASPGGARTKETYEGTAQASRANSTT